MVRPRTGPRSNLIWWWQWVPPRRKACSEQHAINKNADARSISTTGITAAGDGASVPTWAAARCGTPGRGGKPFASVVSQDRRGRCENGAVARLNSSFLRCGRLFFFFFFGGGGWGGLGSSDSRMRRGKRHPYGRAQRVRSQDDVGIVSPADSHTKRQRHFRSKPPLQG